MKHKIVDALAIAVTAAVCLAGGFLAGCRITHWLLHGDESSPTKRFAVAKIPADQTTEVLDLLRHNAKTGDIPDGVVAAAAAMSDED